MDDARFCRGAAGRYNAAMAAARPFLRPVLLGLAGLVLAVLAADTALWAWSTSRLSQALAQWQADAAAAGLQVTHDAPVWAGWPFAAALRLPRAGLVQPAAWGWQADAVTLTITPWQPAVLVIRPWGAQRLTLGEAAPLPIATARFDVQVLLSDAAGAVTHAQGTGIQITLSSGVLAVGHADLQFDATHALLSMQDCALPGSNVPFGGKVDTLAAQASSTVPVPLATNWHDAARSWREAGGRLSIQHAALRWGPLTAEASGALSLDADLQPKGSAALHLTGYGGFIDALSRAGTISRNDARVAATLLGLMAHSSPGAADFVDVPLTVQDGLVSVGAIPLLQLPRLGTP